MSIRKMLALAAAAALPALATAPAAAQNWDMPTAYAPTNFHTQNIEAFAAAVKLDDGDAATQNNLGFLLLSGGRCAEALPHLERAVQVDPSTTRYRNNLAFALVCEGEAQRALQLFRSTGTEAQARYNMGVAYERVDKIPSAILQYQAALAADPEHAGATEALTRLSSPTTEESP